MNTSSKKYKSPKLVGLTGGIGSGKTTVAKLFAQQGIPVFNSDEEAKKLLQNDPSVRERVIAQFGHVYPDGKLDRARLASLVFSDKSKLEALNQIVHPAVGKAFKNWVLANNDAELLLKEAAILIETGLYKELDELILVTCPENERVKRVMQRDGVNEKEVLRRMQNQLSDEEKRPFATYEINTHEEELLPQVLEILTQIKKPH